MNEIIKLLKELAVRLQHESPALFKKIQWVSGLLVIIIPLLLGANTAFAWGWGLIIVPIIKIKLTLLLAWAVTILGGVFGTSKLAVKDAGELEKKLKK